MKKMIPLFLMLTLFIFSKTGFAAFDSYKASSWTNKETTADQIVGKLGFGLLNISAGWTAIPYEMDQHKSTNIFTGLVKGIYRTVVYTVGGVLHAVTFPAPFDIPLPDGGVHFE